MPYRLATCCAIAGTAGLLALPSAAVAQSATTLPPAGTTPAASPMTTPGAAPGTTPAASPAADRAAAEDHAMRGQVYFKANRLAEAEAEFKAAVAADPTWVDALFNLAVVWDTEGHLDLAVAALQQYLPSAAPSERAALRQRIAEMEVKLADQQKAAAQAKAAADAEQARAREQAERDRRRAEAEARAQAALRAAEDKQAFTIRNTDASDPVKDVRLVLENGQSFSCADIGPKQTCVLHPPPGPAVLVWSGGDDNRTIVTVPSGRSEARLKLGPGNGAKVLLTLGALAALSGGIGFSVAGGTAQPTDTGLLVAGGVCGAGVLSMAVVIPLVLGDGFSLGPDTNAVAVAPAGQLSLPRVSVLAVRGGGEATLAFAF